MRADVVALVVAKVDAHKAETDATIIAAETKASTTGAALTAAMNTATAAAGNTRISK
jgi:hypothetical protein